MALDANGHPLSRITQRKLEHLRLSLEASVQSTRSAGFAINAAEFASTMCPS